jgi:hypothetical protein
MFVIFINLKLPKFYMITTLFKAQYSTAFVSPYLFEFITYCL